MPKTRPFAYNTGPQVEGTTKYGNISIGGTALKYSGNPGGLEWWMGPDEDLGYVICKARPGKSQPAAKGTRTSHLSFQRVPLPKTEAAFVGYVNAMRGRMGLTQDITTGGQAATWLFAEGYWTSYVDAGSIYPSEQISPEPYGPLPDPVNSTPYREFSQGTSDNIYSINFDADGNIFIGGLFTTYDGVTANRIVKINPNGDIDPDFDTGTGFNNRPWSVKIGEESGNLLVAGQFTTYKDVSARGFVALDPVNGDLIQHYNVGASVVGYALEEFGDGFVMAVAAGGVSKRFYIDGTVDNTWSFSTGTNPIRAIVKFKDGSNKYIVSRQTGVPGLVITDYNGTIDTTATANMNVTNQFSETWAYGPDDKVIIGSGSMRYGGYSTPIMIVGSDGVFDATFAVNASKFTVSQTVEIMYDATREIIVLTGTTSQGYEYPYNIAPDYHVFDLQGNYLSADGIFDFQSFIWAGALASDGNLVAGGSLRQPTGGLKLNYQPVISSAYQTAVATTSWSIVSNQYDFVEGFVGTVYAIEKYKDKLLVGGDLQSYNGVEITSNIVRLNADGTLDYTFAPTNITGKINKIKWIFGTDVVLVGGAFTGYLKAYNENGSENSDWTATFDGEVRALWHDRYKKKVVIGGAFTGGIKVFSEYGVLDSTFITGSGFNGRVNDIFWENQRSTRMLVVGNFTQYNGVAVNVPKITLLNEDGSLYQDTVTGTGFDGEPYFCFPNSSLSQVYIGGSFSNYNGNGAGNFAYVSIFDLRSDADGEPVNNAWTRPNQFNGPVYGMGYLNNRNGISTYNVNYVVVGDFTQYQVGEPGYGFKTVGATGIARIGQGYWDLPSEADWQEGVSTDGPVYAVASQFMNGITDDPTYNNWIIGGAFTSFDGATGGSIVQIGATGYKL